jgi:D-glycero-D-manno-heptose 1,7-bisphosphate phosphatase
MVQQAVVLVGGKGTRLGALTKSMPKPLLDVAGRPFLDILVRQLVRHAFSRITFLAGFEAEKILAYADSLRFPGVTVEVVCETEPLGTAGCLTNIKERLDETFLVVNGDTYFDINLLALLDVFQSGVTTALALCKVPDASRYATVRHDTNGRVTAFLEKSFSAEGSISGGIAMMRRSVIERLTPGFAMLEYDVFPNLIRDGSVYAKCFYNTFIDIGVPKSYAEAQNILEKIERRPAIFFDRDGTLNHDKGYTYKTEDLQWTDHATSAVRKANDAGFYVFVVTNQAGVARGFYEEADVVHFQQHMQQVLRRAGAHLDDFRYCPHHPDGVREVYARHCNCRKPATGMLRSLCDAWPVDVERSIMIGDHDKDRACAEAFGVKFIFADGSNLEKALAPHLEHDDFGLTQSAIMNSDLALLIRRKRKKTDTPY